jgi:hypothetical protein
MPPDLCLPRRPDRTSERRRRPQRIVYHAVELSPPTTPRRFQTIYRSDDSVHIERSRAIGSQSEYAGGFRFALGEELSLLSTAVAYAATAGPPHHIGSFRVKSGVAVSVDAAAGSVSLRWVLPSGEKRPITKIQGVALSSLRRAAEDLQATRGKSAVVIERNTP